MVTDAQWADIDGSGKNALIVVGDWMPVTILKYVKWKAWQKQVKLQIPPGGGIAWLLLTLMVTAN